MKPTRFRKAFVGLLLLSSAACASGPQPVVAQSGAARQDSARLIPAGYGTLREDEFTVSLRSGSLLIKVTPLAEEVIRTAAPDTYDRLHKMAASRQAEAERKAGPAAHLQLFKVSFFSYEQDVEYQPENLQITHQGRQLRAAAILPLRPTFGRQRLAQQASEDAIYVFNLKVDYLLPMTVRYNQDQGDQWTSIVQKLEVERAKIAARSRS